MVSYIVLIGRWCIVTFLKAHSPSEEKTVDSKHCFYVELEQNYDNFPKFDTKILRGDFNAKEGREDIFKPTNRNESLHQDSNNNGTIITNVGTS